MIYLVEGNWQDDRMEWCHDNDIRYIRGSLVTPIYMFLTLGMFRERHIEKITFSLILFKEEDAMAYKLRWL